MTEKMKSVMKELETKLHGFAEELYRNASAQQQQQQQGEPAQGPAEGPKAGRPAEPGTDGDVIDADFEETVN